MSYLLSIDSSTTVCSVALHHKGALIGKRTVYEERSHAGKLGVLTKQLLADCGISTDKLSAIAFSGGPGSYTGLRIGCSFAKGICFALHIPLITVGTLEAMACQVIRFHPEIPYFCPMLDARRMEVYTMITDPELSILEPVQPLILNENTDILDKYLKKDKVAFFGNGATKAVGHIKHPNALFIKGIETEAEAVGQLSWNKFIAKDFADLAYYEPFYLKEFKATVPKKML